MRDARGGTWLGVPGEELAALGARLRWGGMYRGTTGVLLSFLSNKRSGRVVNATRFPSDALWGVSSRFATAGGTTGGVAGLFSKRVLSKVTSDEITTLWLAGSHRQYAFEPGS